MVKDILRHQPDALGRHKGFFAVDVPDVLVVDVRLLVHRFDVVHPEGQHVVVVDGVHDGVGMQRAHRVALRVRIAAKQLGRGFHRAFAAAGGVY